MNSFILHHFAMFSHDCSPQFLLPNLPISGSILSGHALTLEATGTPRSTLDFGVSPGSGVPQVGKDLPKLPAAGLRDVVPPRCANLGKTDFSKK